MVFITASESNPGWALLGNVGLAGSVTFNNQLKKSYPTNVLDRTPLRHPHRGISAFPPFSDSTQFCLLPASVT